MGLNFEGSLKSGLRDRSCRKVESQKRNLCPIRYLGNIGMSPLKGAEGDM